MTRYAVYGVPGAGPNPPAAAVRVRGAVERWYARDGARTITVDPRRYGFHATLKAPFRLTEGRTADELLGAVRDFAATRDAVVLPRVAPAIIGRFRALVPATEPREANALAADIVRDFDPFRAPLTAYDRARRDPDRLTPRQRELLDEFGYPYVLDEFRLHMTLTDALDPAGAAVIDEAIANHFADVTGIDVPLTALTVAVEPAPGEPFAHLASFPLRSGGAPIRPTSTAPTAQAVRDSTTFIDTL